MDSDPRMRISEGAGWGKLDSTRPEADKVPLKCIRSAMCNESSKDQF